MNKFTVTRSKWYRGNGAKYSRLLLDEDKGRMCCLGMAALACGYDEDDIFDVSSPARIFNDSKPKGFFDQLLSPTLSGDSHICQELMHKNDDPEISESDREAYITELFASIGVEVTFED